MAIPNDEQLDLTLRERLEGLMAFRVVIVTLLLGSAIAFDAQALSSLSDPKNLILLSLIVGTYLLTIGYAVLLRSEDNLVSLARAQVLNDMVVSVVLVFVTSGVDSLFTFLFFLNIISAAIVVGRGAALIMAGLTSMCLTTLALDATEVIELARFSTASSSRSLGNLAYIVGVNSVAAFLIALLSGYLSERLGRVAGELERQQFNVEELRALNRNILTSLSSGLITVDEARQIIFFNRAAEHITGLSSDEVYGESLAELFPKLSEALSRDMDGTRTPSETRLEVEYERPDGKTAYLGFSVSVLRDSLGNDAGRIVIFQDLSEVKRLEEEKKRSERLAAVGELAAAIAHEIRNPLASISGSVEMLEAVGDLEGEDRALMRIVVREVDRLDSLITSFLDYSRPKSLSREPTDIRRLIQDVTELFEKRSDVNGLELVLRLGEEEQPFIADVDREAFRQVLWNLLNNAREAIAEVRGESHSTIVLQLAQTNGSLVLSVEDSGPGIDEDVKERIFEPFFTTKEGGTGLGLATIYRIVEEHDGTLRITAPKELDGARFEIVLEPSHADLTSESKAS
jgi:two-component system sensor histidine kinase PilS (NtrC family)